jgi:predicted  nucleic acid-binding Zn-ribbon protein
VTVLLAAFGADGAGSQASEDQTRSAIEQCFSSGKALAGLSQNTEAVKKCIYQRWASETRQVIQLTAEKQKLESRVKTLTGTTQQQGKEFEKLRSLHEQTVARHAAESQKFEAEAQALQAEITQLKDQSGQMVVEHAAWIQDLTKENSTLRDEVKQLNDRYAVTVPTLNAEKLKLESENKKLAQEVSRLKVTATDIADRRKALEILANVWNEAKLDPNSVTRAIPSADLIVRYSAANLRLGRGIITIVPAHAIRGEYFEKNGRYYLIVSDDSASCAEIDVSQGTSRSCSPNVGDFLAGSKSEAQSVRMWAKRVQDRYRTRQ